MLYVVHSFPNQAKSGIFAVYGFTYNNNHIPGNSNCNDTTDKNTLMAAIYYNLKPFMQKKNLIFYQD